MTKPASTITEALFDDSDDRDIDPFDVFASWLGEAVESEVNDPTAMALATVDDNGLPDLRMVLMNGRDERGFVFFTNFESAKAEELLAHPSAALLFHWKSLRRQVRIRGPVEQVTDAEADAYFATRPLGSRIGAHASQQSRPLKSRAELLARVEKLTAEFGEKVPRPAHWSGFRVMPLQIEFWKDGEYRLHDRMLFSRDSLDAGWRRVRLNP